MQRSSTIRMIQSTQFYHISDDDSSIEYGNDGSISSADGDDPNLEASEGAHLPPSPQDEPVLQRSRRLRREYNPGTEGLERHPDFARGFTSSLVTKPMKYAKPYLEEHRTRFALTHGIADCKMASSFDAIC